MDTNRSSIFLKLSISIVGLFIYSISFAQLVVDGIDLMEGFTFGAVAETFDPADYQGRHWTVTRTDDPDPFATEAEMYGSLRWAINKTNETPGINYIDFDLPEGSVIHLINRLPDFRNSSVVIDGKPELNKEPDVTIDARAVDVSDMNPTYPYYNHQIFNFRQCENVVIQGLTFRNYIFGALRIIYSSDFKVLCNVFNCDPDFVFQVPETATYTIMDCGIERLFIKGNIIGTDLNLNMSYGPRRSGISSGYTKDVQVGGELKQEGNIIANVDNGFFGTGSGNEPYRVIPTNFHILNNIFYSNKLRLHYYGSHPINIIFSSINNLFSKNLFYECDDLIRLGLYANNNKPAPQITSADESTGNVIISGTTSQENDEVEIFLSTESGKDVIKYLGTAVANVQDPINPDLWQWQIIQGSTEWDDPEFYLETGQKLLATATDVFNNTSEFSDPFATTQISERVLTFAPVCSANPSSSRRWRIQNNTVTNISCEYTSPIDQSVVAFQATPGESFLVVDISEPTWSGPLQVSYSYEGEDFDLSIPVSLEACQGISCEFYDFTLTPQHIYCADQNTGAVTVDLAGAQLVSYQWSNGASQLNLTDLYMGRYTLTVTVLDNTGAECVKTKSVEIREDDVDIKVKVNDIEGCENTGSVELIGIMVKPLSSEEFSYKCEDAPEETYPEVDCEQGEELFGSDPAIIGAGETRVIPPGYVFDGDLTINGGSLIVCGYIQSSAFTFNSGEIIINGTMIQNTLDIPTGSSVINYGTLECEYINVSGDFVNIYDATCEYDMMINSSGSFINYGDIVVDNNLINNAQIDNYKEIEVSVIFSNQNGAQLNNYCTFVTDEDFDNSGIVNNDGFINIFKKLTNNSSGVINVLAGSEFIIGTLENSGTLNTNSSDCFCFTVISGTELNANSSINNLFLTQSSGQCNCSYSTGEAHNALIVELDEESITPTTIVTDLGPGEHNILVDIDGCEVGKDFFVDGGIYFDVMEDQKMCQGDEIWLAISTLGDETQINWDNQETIIDYIPNETAQLVKPEVTTTYTVDVLTVDGCTDSRSMTVEVIPPLELDLTEDASVCQGGSITLNASIDGPATYIWTPDDELSALDIHNPVATPGETKEFYVKVIEATSGMNCSAFDSITVEVNPLPDVTIGPVEEGIGDCENLSVQLEAEGATTYSWSPTEGLSNPNIYNPVASPEVTTEYTVTGTDDNNCSSTASVTIEKVVKPDIEIGIDESVCIAPKRQLYVRGGGDTFIWTPAEFLNNPTIAEPVADITEETVFTVEVLTDEGCTYYEQITANLPDWPVADNVSVYFGEPAQLNASGGTDYRWSPEYGLNNTNIPNPISNVQATTSYSLTAKNSFGCDNTIKVFVYVDPSGRCEALNSSGNTFLWTGAVSTNWNDPGNWDDGTGGTNIPGDNPGEDNVIIEDISGSSPNYPKLTNDVEIHRICLKGGELDLDNYVFLINGDATLSGGEIKGVITETYADALKLSLDGSKGSETVYFGNVILNCNVAVQSSPGIFLNGATFNGSTIIEQNGNEQMVCTGGNIYNGETRIINSGSGDWHLAYINEGSFDKYNGDVTFVVTGSGKLYPNATQEDEFKGDIYIEGDGIVFGSNGGITILNAPVDQYIGGNVTTPPIFRKLVINKNEDDSGEDVDLAYADLYLEIPIKIGLNNNTDDKLVLNDGIIFTTQENILVISNKVSIEGVSNLSFVDGPVKKIGNEDFTFPVGKIDRYVPIGISGAESPNSTTEFIAEFVEESPDGLPEEPIEDISSCEYWFLYKPLNDADNVKVTLYWDRKSCDIPTDVTKLKVAARNTSSWTNLGMFDYTGSRSEGGSIISEISATHFDAFALGAEIMPGYGPTVGTSLNNYGANISVINCDISVNGNILNEKDNNDNPGVINNTGNVIIANDWTNNAQKEVFGETEGSINFNGNYQRIRGTEPTEFDQLLLAGFGKKEMFANVDVSTKLNLFNNQLETREFSLFINTGNEDAIENMSGFVSSMDKGHIARILTTKSNIPYLFPVGGNSLYRPIFITPLNDLDIGDNEDDILRVRLIYHDPSKHGADVNVRSASVANVNQNYFYEIEKDGTPNDDPFSLEVRFNRAIDGGFQSIGQWGENPFDDYVGSEANPLWLKLSYITPVLDYTDAALPNRLILDTISDFTYPKFALIQGAFIINTNFFGDPFENGSNVNFTMSGEGFSDGSPVYDSQNPEYDELGQPVAPSDMTVEHIMQIYGDPLTIPGFIVIYTDGNGDIKPMEDDEDQYQIYFIDENDEKKPLARDLYSVNNRNILELYQEPESLKIKCNTDLKVSFSASDPLVYSISNPSFSIEGKSSDKIQSMVIISPTGNRTTISNPITSISNAISGEGAYKFELNISTDTGTQIFKGQFMVVN